MGGRRRAMKGGLSADECKAAGGSVVVSPDGKRCHGGTHHNISVVSGGRRTRRSLKARTLRRMLKKKGMKTTGRKATLMRRLKMRGGGSDHTVAPADTNVGADRHGYTGSGYVGSLASA